MILTPDIQFDQDINPTHFMCDGCICCYNACNFDDITICCTGTGDCLCIRQEECCAIGQESLGIGVVTDPSRDEICTLALNCCEIGIVIPNTLCSYANHCLFYQSVAALPFHKEYVDELVCSYCCFQCLPSVGCLLAPPNAPIFYLRRSPQPASTVATTIITSKKRVAITISPPETTTEPTDLATETMERS